MSLSALFQLKTRRAQAGFTLVEVLLAISILAAITAVTWVSVSTMFDTRDYMDERFQRYQMVRAAMSRMERELAGAYLAGPDNGGEPLPGEEDEAMEEQLSSGRFAQIDEPVQFGMIATDDQMDFTSFAHIRTLEGEPTSEHAEIGYYLERRQNDAGQMVQALMRREDTSLDDDITRGGQSYMMIPEVEKVKFEYWDPGEVEVGTLQEMVKSGRWVDRWDTTHREFAGRLPTRVRIQITLPPMNARSRSEIFTIQAQLATTEVLEL